MSQSKATAETLAQSHIPMHTTEFLSKENAIPRESHHKFLSLIPVILTVIFVLAAVSCGGGGTPPSNAPVANPGGPYLGNVNQSLAFNGSGSAPSGRTITSFVWNFGDGGSANGATTAHTYILAGNYTATLTVTDSSGATNSSSVAVQIITAPVAKPGGPYTGKVGVAVSFDGSASTAPPGQALSYTWSFGDGSGSVSGAKPTHTYGSVCTCNVTLTVLDDTAGTSFASTTATIVAGPGPSGQTASPSTFFAIGPAANVSTQFAYTLRSAPGSPSALSIETIDTTTGNLRETGLAAPALDSNFVPSGMITDPSRKFLYLYGGNSVRTFSISSDTGALTQSGITATNGSTDCASNQFLIFNPNGKFAFFITQEPISADTTAPGSITLFSADPNTGILGAIETVPAQIENPQSAAIDPSGKFLYISGVAPNPAAATASSSPQIAVFAVAQDSGELAPVSGSPLLAESGILATSMTIDSTGSFIYAAGISPTTNSPTLTVLGISKDTGVVSQKFPPFSLDAPGASVSSIVLSPLGGSDYTLTTSRRDDHTAQQSLQLFKRDKQTGAPISVDLVAWATVPADPVAIPAGNLIPIIPDQNAAVSNTRSVEFLVLTASTAPAFTPGFTVFWANPDTGLLATFPELPNPSKR